MIAKLNRYAPFLIIALAVIITQTYFFIETVRGGRWTDYLMAGSQILLVIGVTWMLFRIVWKTTDGKQ